MRSSLVGAGVMLALTLAACSLPWDGQVTGGGDKKGPGPDAPGTLLRSVPLNSSVDDQAISRTVKSRVSQVFLKQLLSAYSSNTSHSQAITSANDSTTATTIGQLKASGLFEGTMYSDSSVVLLVQAAGDFVVTSESNYGPIDHHYRTALGIYDPGSGELLGLGLLP